MRKLATALILIAGCTAAQPAAVNVRGDRGYCPICVMWHDADEMRWPIGYKGRVYRFCDPNCRARFERDPDKYLADPKFNPPEATPKAPP